MGSITIDKKGHFIMIKKSIPPKSTMYLNVYAFDNRTPKYMMQKLTELKQNIDISTILIRDLTSVYQ